MSTAKTKMKSGGAPSWMVTFADLMALLLTLFVLLLSFSTMETQRFKDLAGNLRDAFGFQKESMLTGLIERGGTPTHTAKTMALPVPVAKILPVDEQAEGEVADAPQIEGQPADAFAEQSQKTLSRLQDEMASEIENSLIDVVSAGDVTIIRFPDQVSFMSGSGELLNQFLPTMQKIVVVLEDAIKEGNAHIIISGHTDDIPITTERYRSNWDLSTARAASVAHYLLANTTISPSKITVQGYADSRPLMANTGPINRAANRRVEIAIRRYDGDDNENNSADN
ncbi:MAG: OmpA family protein [Rhodospirillaceae bacterium]|nr:OmpA family protein [Rhodospirillaceae bacterium]MCK5547206.1 OmpA family protein [Rhodospirillaceae bacterium]